MRVMQQLRQLHQSDGLTIYIEQQKGEPLNERDHNQRSRNHV